ncbi:MAG: NADH:flavin oxidoreductase [Rhodobacteraceae bacterium]|nr:MAG: NADH:flavin oxidoreductase [Paracoccaceae bacterium]
MTRDKRYDILFEPVKIGPITTKNRFYQVPHCNGMGHRYPKAMAAMRGMKAAGGWGVVCTEECEIHPSSDLSPAVEMRLWDDSDIPTHRLMTSAVHENGGLAGIQLVHNGANVANYTSRMPPLAPSDMATTYVHPLQARGMDKQDIRDLRRWHRDAALRAKSAGYDIVYVYAGHNMTLLMHYMLSRYNHRTDEYGGSLENRVRLVREILEDTKEAVGGTCAVAFRFAVDELMGEDGMRWNVEGKEIVEMLSGLPDLWDVNIAGWENDSLPSRFGAEGSQEEYIKFVKQATNKPVVGVGRFTSPDAMVSQIKRGVLDLIGAARPSIADPYLPNKINEGRHDEIRECIGCNMCVAGDFTSTPMRCTQNPTIAEEYRKGWHPEIISPKKSDASVLVLGGGPAGLEATLALSKRGYDVILADGAEELGGRVLLESRMPGLGEWKRVADHRTYMIGQKPNVETYLNSCLTAHQVLEFGFDHVLLATGAAWRSDGVGRSIIHPLQATEATKLVSADHILKGGTVDGKVVIFDDEHYYMGSVIAEHLRDIGHDVTLVTPSTMVAEWTEMTMEQHRIQQGLLEKGVTVICTHTLSSIGSGEVTLSCEYTGKAQRVAADTVIPITTRKPDRTVYDGLMAQSDAFADNGIKSVTRIADCHAPGTIAMAVYAGHQYAQELECEVSEIPFKRENQQP